MATIININVSPSLLPSGNRAFGRSEPLPVKVEPIPNRAFFPVYFDDLTPIPDQIFTRAKNCKKGQACGNSCISLSKTCRKDLTPAQKAPAKEAKTQTKTKKSNKQQNDTFQGIQSLVDHQLIDIVSTRLSDSVTTDPAIINDLAQTYLGGGGNIRPLIVRRDGPENFEVVSGGVEFLAAQKAREINPMFEMTRAVILDDYPPEKQSAINQQLKLLEKIKREVPETPPSPANQQKKGVETLLDYSLIDIDSTAIATPPKATKKLINDLAQSYLESGGNLNPLVVKRNGPENFEVVSGGVEFLAAQRAKELNPKFEMARAIILDAKREADVLKQIQILETIAP